MSTRLFPTNLPECDWREFSAAGFTSPVSGVIYRGDTPAVNGMPLGGIDTRSRPQSLVQLGGGILVSPSSFGHLLGIPGVFYSLPFPPGRL